MYCVHFRIYEDLHIRSINVENYQKGGERKSQDSKNFLKIFILCDSLSSLMIKLNTN